MKEPSILPDFGGEKPLTDRQVSEMMGIPVPKGFMFTTTAGDDKIRLRRLSRGQNLPKGVLGTQDERDMRLRLETERKLGAQRDQEVARVARAQTCRRS